jgi:hypothetical protein
MAILNMGSESEKNAMDDATRSRVGKSKRPVETAIFSTRNLKRRSGHAEQADDVNVREDREIILVIRGIIERFVIPKDRKVTLGRADVKMRYVPDIDLTPYGALDRGVSREHANLWLKNGEIFLEDLESTNGTFVAGDQLAPNKLVKIERGDELMFGRLAIQILFR